MLHKTAANFNQHQQVQKKTIEFSTQSDDFGTLPDR